MLSHSEMTPRRSNHHHLLSPLLLEGVPRKMKSLGRTDIHQHGVLQFPVWSTYHKQSTQPCQLQLAERIRNSTCDDSKDSESPWAELDGPSEWRVETHMRKSTVRTRFIDADFRPRPDDVNPTTRDKRYPLGCRDRHWSFKHELLRRRPWIPLLCQPI
jgi:hypothetical protein